jgi:hypothetical protein
MRLSPQAIGMAAFLAVVAIGIMALAALGFWPPKPSSQGASIEPTPHTAQAVAVLVEKVGSPVRISDTVTVTLKVTNNVLMSVPFQGTQPADAPTPTAGPTDLYNASIKVIFYKVNGGKKELVGSGLGNATDLGFHQSKEIQVVSTSVGNFTDYDAFADTVTSKAAIKPDVAPATGTAQPAAPASPTP